jgi:hypothetical protein
MSLMKPLSAAALLALLAFLAQPATLALAQSTTAKGIGSVRYSSAPTARDRGDALRAAKVNALERWFAETNSAQYENWQRAKDRIVADLDSYFLSTTVLTEDDDINLRELRVVIRGELNTARLSNMLRDTSAVASGPAGDRSMLTFVFVSREQAAIKSYEARVHERTDTSSSADVGVDRSHAGAEGEAISRRSIETSESESATFSASTKTSDSVTHGGSVTRQADKVSWRVANSAEINSVVTGIFTNAGFEVVEAEYLEYETDGLLSVQALKDDYSTGDDLSPATMRNAVKGVQSVGGRYLALGTLDGGMRDIDSATGLQRVYVTVLAKVLDVSGRFPRTVSSVGPKQYAGLGPTEMVAKTNALSQAAEAAAQQLMHELNARGVR